MSKAEKYFNEQIEICKSELEDRERSDDNIRYVRHDLKNHLITIKGYILKNENEEAIKYIDSLLENGGLQNTDKIQSGNIAVDAVMNNKIKTAENMNVEIIPHVLIPEDIYVDAATICVILGNLLDNAIEAASKLSDDRKIYSDIIYHKGALVINIKNGYDGKLSKNKHGKFITSKKNPENHGFGMSSVKNAVKKYDGSITISTENHEFITTVVLYEHKNS